MDNHPLGNDWKKIAGQSTLLLLAIGGYGCSMFFSPGWANGWPFGITVYSVFSIAWTLWMFTMIQSTGVIIGALACIILSRLKSPKFLESAMFAFWMPIWTALSVVVSFSIYRHTYSESLTMWPNGYNP